MKKMGGVVCIEPEDISIKQEVWLVQKKGLLRDLRWLLPPNGSLLNRGGRTLVDS